MHQQSSGRKVVITGASSGIGLALAHAFAARGDHLGLAARRLPALEQAAGEIRARYPNIRVDIALLDVDQDQQVEANLHQLFDNMGEVDIVIVNAGINDFTKVGRGQLQAEKRIIQTNVIGAIATVDAAVSYMLPRGGGQVVGISSLASLQGIPGQAAYCASKAAFSMYLSAARVELRRKNIHVTTILPGFVKTDIMESIEQYPFCVSAEQAAREILNAVNKKKKIGIVPGWPWKLLRPFFGHFPARLLR